MRNWFEIEHFLKERHKLIAELKKLNCALVGSENVHYLSNAQLIEHVSEHEQDAADGEWPEDP